MPASADTLALDHATPDAVRPPVADSIRGYWLFSAPVDLAVFLGSAVFALLAVAVGAWLGLLTRDAEAPDWAWVPAVLLIDVAHVYATGFRVYLDPSEVRRRPLLYTLVPALGLALGIALYSEGEFFFWRVLAYLAVFHFVRQQYGWVALYRARAGERDMFGRWVDTAAIYAATLYPLLYWHAYQPHRFGWFLTDDLAALPPVLEQVARPLYIAALVFYACRSVYRGLARGGWNPGKDVVVLTTAVCWYVGIVALDSDYAFMVTNVVIHGVPYLVLVYWYRYARPWRRAASPRDHLRTLVIFLATLWALAYVEEMFWDRGVLHERSWLFGTAWDVARWKLVLVPLLALPQLTHYVLDGFIWRRKSNPAFSLVPAPRPDQGGDARGASLFGFVSFHAPGAPPGTNSPK
jgi:hypothetical protein